MMHPLMMHQFMKNHNHLFQHLLIVFVDVEFVLDWDWCCSTFDF